MADSYSFPGVVNVPCYCIVIKVGIVITNTEGFEKSIRKLFKCLSGGKVVLIFAE